jgi:hypothetical protein
MIFNMMIEAEAVSETFYLSRLTVLIALENIALLMSPGAPRRGCGTQNICPASLLAFGFKTKSKLEGP